MGVWFGDGDIKNLSEKLIGKQTNQRAELNAVLRALQIIGDGADIEIRTDSMYSIKCATIWSQNWIRNGWKNSRGADVENQDLIKSILATIKKRIGKVDWKHVRGHSGNYGNDQADSLATKAIK